MSPEKALLRRKPEVIPTPFNFSPSGIFEGNDGSWSTFIIRVGTPAQTFRVLISTSGQETWVPLVDGCADFDPLNCGALRGVQDFQNAPSGGFRTNLSSTWELINLYNLALEDHLDGYTGAGLYGFDTVGLQLPNSGGITLNHSIVAGIGTKHFMLGIFGIGPGTTNFDDFNDPQPSFMGSLKNQSLIPSLSYSYHAGASYEKTPASLVLGGYDASQFDVSKVSTVRFNTNGSYTLPVALQVIQASGTLNGVVTLLPEGIMTTIDSTIPEIWLPVAACEKFEKSFGLQLDNSTGRYLVNDTMHMKLKELNPVITFKLGNQTYGGETLNIVLPYAAFDLQVNYPIYPNATNYFPLRRAMNDSQYVIGRTFLQEAYIVVDYERQNFSISQRVSQGTPTYVPILSTSHHAKPGGLEKGSKIGIAIGVVVGSLLLLAGAAVWYWKRKQVSMSGQSGGTEEPGGTPGGEMEVKAAENMTEMSSPGAPVWEFPGDTTIHPEELDSGPVLEIGDREVPHSRAELPAS
ncbi:aspartic peptidase domain-containing protein [Rhexocercosporidium sp. MPI-PUGE-AT-0058]|nr:aspartic peptidase domain-containing protein [Rhexocercosporidium sp. MPI-PUGE-AT-0058]